jgi:glucokinase
MDDKVFLIADIGGTNARFAVADRDGAEIISHAYKVREYPTLPSALRDFCNNFATGFSYAAAGFAVAGPVVEEVVRFTNSDWVCDPEELSKILLTKNIFVLNDFEAVALAIGRLNKSDMIPIQVGNLSVRHPMVVMGPGTGLGVAALAPTAEGGLKAYTTEAGHIRFAPANEHERKIIRLLTRTYNLVSAENLLSGPGLVNLYRANCIMASHEFVRLSPAEIVEKARDGDALARQVLDDFAALFGSFASQMALSWNALGGVYLTGGVMQKIGDLFDTDRFLERFNTNPRMADLLARIPIMRIRTEIPAFAGLLTVLKRGQ